MLSILSLFSDVSRGGQTKSQIANPQILGLTPLSQIRKFLMHAIPQITNPQIFIVNNFASKQS
jgi:hypothetical protein